MTKTILVTGASRGIGRAIAVAFAEKSVFNRIILIARNREKLAIVAKEIHELGAEAIVIPLDITDSVAVNIAIAKVWRDHGPIDLLVNCAGVCYQNSFLNSKLSQVEEELALNLMGMYSITRAVARRMASRKKGTIANVSSLMGKIAAPTMSTYSATKFAILGFTQALRGELSPYNVKVISLLPSLTDTDMTRKLKLFALVQSSSPRQVAEAFIRGLSRGDKEIVVGWQGYLAVLGQRLIPQLVEKIILMASPK